MNAFEAIAKAEMEMVATAPERYGKFYDTAANGSLFLGHFLKSINPDRWIFASFLSQVKKHHALALLSVVRGHQVQSMMNLRQVIEAGTCAAYAIANIEHTDFVYIDDYGILDPSKTLTVMRYKWLEKHYTDESNKIKGIKDTFNEFASHSNLIYGQKTFQYDDWKNRFDTPFFDIGDEYHVKTDLWMLTNVGLILMDLFYKVNNGRNVIEFADDFPHRMTTLATENDTLKAGMISSDRYKEAMAIANARNGKE